jgi:hypothetical protein
MTDESVTAAAVPAVPTVIVAIGESLIDVVEPGAEARRRELRRWSTPAGRP